MKKYSKLVMLATIGCISLLASCSDPSSSISGGGGGGSNSSTSDQGDTSDFYVTFKGTEVSDGDTFDVYVNEPTAIISAYYTDGATATATYTSSAPNIISVNTNGLLTVHAAGSASITITTTIDGGEGSITLNFNASAATVSSGAKSYASVSYDEKANILGVLENYAVDNYLTGLTIFSNGGYVVYNNRYVPTPSSYVSGYGWGTMKEGVLTSDLPITASGRHPNYYNVGQISQPGHANAMDASGSDVSDLASYFTTAYYSTRLNATNDGYEWYPSLATDTRPIPVDENGNVLSNVSLNRRWIIHVRTGDNAPVYRTSSTATTPSGTRVSSFDGRKVTLEDYLTPFKFMLTYYNGQYRGAELTDGISGFTDAARYFNSTAANTTGELYNEELWNQIMGDSSTANKLNENGQRGSIITGTDEDGDYIEFNLLYPCTQFYAMYYLSSSLYSPLPMDFIKAWGANSLGKSPSGYNPVDTMLYSGPYYIDSWNTQLISLKRNDDFYEYKEGYLLNDGITTRQPYQIPGFDFVKTSSDNLEQQFLNGEIDSYAPTKDTLANYASGAGTSSHGIKWTRYVTEGDSNFKLNINSQTQEQWDERFGPNGTVTPHTSNDSWSCKPFMSNKNFLDFLSFSLDRQSFCASRGMEPTQDYFSDNYLIDPESGISYNSTDAHKAVLADRYNATYGYNVDAAKDALREAIEGEGGIAELTRSVQGGQSIPGISSKTSGANPGSSENPWVITVDMYWMNTTDVTDYGDVFNSVVNVFNQVSQEDYGGMYELNINQHPGSGDFNEVYDRMKEGMFDLGFGAISGNDLNPINFLEVLKSDQSSGFTLNWGADTGERSDEIIYDGQTWSFDALWQATDTVAAVSNDGELAKLENVSTGGTSNGTRYQNLTSTNVTYQLSLDTLIQGGAVKDSIELTVSNASNAHLYTYDELGVNSSNIFNLVIGNEFNTQDIVDENTGEVTTSKCVTVTITVNFNIVIDGTTYESSININLPTAAGLN